MTYKCLFVNPIRNGKTLVTYFKEREQEVYALIEVGKIRKIKQGEISQGEKDEFDPRYYSKCFFSIEQVLESGIDFDFIIPGGEAGVESCDILTTKLGLVGNDSDTTDYRRDKFIMQEQLKLKGLPYAKSMLVDLSVGKRLSVESLKGFSFPVVLKPAYGTGTQEVFYCKDIEEVNTRLEKIEYGTINWTFSKTTHFVIQEFLEGEEYGLDYIVHKNVPYVYVVSRYYKNFKVGNKHIRTEVLFFSPDDPKYASLIEYGKKVLNALQLKDGAAHIEFISNGEEHFMIDLGARMRGGGYTSHDDRVYSMGLLEAIYDKYINDGRNLKDSILVRHGIYSAINASKGGVFQGLSSSEKERLAQLPLLKELKLDLQINQPYERTIDLLSSKGVAKIIGEDKIEVANTAREIYMILENHLGDWYQNIPLDIESCN
ncbi:MAG: ATP-grasp domain-containing protein [Flavobacteriaceae bacterium]|nr:ATP-grasp domain-containing protein [Flavobacteriaceae bacterium]